MLTFHKDQQHHLIEITISGKINHEELSKVIKEMEPSFKSWPEIRVLKRVDSFEGIEWRALVDDLKFAYRNLSNFKKIKKVAVVSDKEWVEKISQWIGPLFVSEFKVFENEDIEKAREWLI